MSKLTRNIIIVFTLIIAISVVAIISRSSLNPVSNVDTFKENISSTESNISTEVISEDSVIPTPSTEVPTEISDMRDPLYDKSKYKFDKDSTSIESDVDVSAFNTEQSKNVVRALAKEFGYSSVNMFHTYTEYSAGILTTVYYITFDEQKVYYIFEQGTNAYYLEDTEYTYSDVLESLAKE